MVTESRICGTIHRQQLGDGAAAMPAKPETRGYINRGSAGHQKDSSMHKTLIMGWPHSLWLPAAPKRLPYDSRRDRTFRHWAPDKAAKKATP
jgi:hypothetical protein